jgi:hypothetical protein
LNDSERIFLTVEDDFLYADMDVFVGDTTKQNQDIESIKTLLQPAMQNGATLMEAAEILSADNLSQIKLKLGEIEERKQQLMAQQAKMEADAVQIENELKMEDLRLREEDSIRRSETLIQVEMIKQAAAGEDKDQNGVADLIQDWELKLQKQRDDARIKDEQLKETVRKNKKAEDQKQQEIEIKRKQANRPVASANNK